MLLNRHFLVDYVLRSSGFKGFMRYVTDISFSRSVKISKEHMITPLKVF